MSSVLSKAEGYFSHAKSCKRPLDECKTCSKGREFFDSLPAQTLNTLLTDARPVRRGHRVAAIVVENLMDRTKENWSDDNTRQRPRAAADVAAAMQVLSGYGKRGGGI